MAPLFHLNDLDDVPRLTLSGESWWEWRDKIEDVLLKYGCLDLVEGKVFWPPWLRIAEASSTASRHPAEAGTLGVDTEAGTQDCAERLDDEEENFQAKRAAWLAPKEERAQAILMVSVARHVRSHIRNMSAREMWEYCADLRPEVSSQEKGDIVRRIYALLLAPRANGKMMDKHLQNFQALMLEAERAGLLKEGEEDKQIIEWFEHTLLAPEYRSITIDFENSDRTRTDWLQLLIAYNRETRSRYAEERQSRLPYSSKSRPRSRA